MKKGRFVKKLLLGFIFITSAAGATLILEPIRNAKANKFHLFSALRSSP
jgi:hypothetical protein